MVAHGPLYTVENMTEHLVAANTAGLLLLKSRLFGPCLVKLCVSGYALLIESVQDTSNT